MDVDMICKEANMVCCEPQPIVSKTVKKNQLPLYDTFGPFPDETVLSNVDRLLCLLGTQRMQKLFNMPMPCMDVCPSDVSINVECPDTQRSCTTVVTDASCITTCSPPVCSAPCCCTKCRPCKPVCVKIENVPKCRDKKSPSPRKCGVPLKRSFSLCSLACRKIKQVCFQGPKGQNSGGSDGCSTKSKSSNCPPSKRWIWTRMYSQPNGCEVYEIFKTTCTCMHPSQIKVKTCPKLIFVVLPNGMVMPFETISHH